MVKKRKGRHIGFASAVLAAAALAAVGCSSTESEEGKASVTPATSAPNQAKEEYKLPFAEPGTASLRVATADNLYAPKSLTQGLPVWNEIEKRTGVKINWEVVPSAQYTEFINVRLAAGRNLPDIFRLTGSPVKASADGVVIPLDDLIAKHAPNIRKLFADFPAVESQMRAPDGKIYAIQSVNSGANINDPFGWLIRKDWLDKLGLKEPQTLDEWYTVLKAFKEKDPNGNGRQDEIPLSPDYSYQGLGIFGSAFGLHNFVYSNGYFPDKNNKVEYHWIKPETKELVTWFNKLYSEGLIDSQFAVNKVEQIDSGISRNLVGVTNHFVNNVNRYNSMLKQTGVQSDWVITNPPKGPNHEPFYEMGPPLGLAFGISKDAKNPELAMKWLDYIYASEEGARLVTFGIEGQSYKVENGKPQFTDWVSNNPDKLSFNEALRSLGALPTTPWLRMTDGFHAAQPIATLEKDPALAAQVNKVKKYIVDSIPKPHGTQAEVEELARLENDVHTYVGESIVKFITGRTQMTEWDTFVKNTKSMGLDRILQIRQQQLDRYWKASKK
ncbi:extracellular solute-binding protein [Paenibacillus koleovorans]|uniref:extracellular solute-binding protein n=1 Tax=Paenibacillus koleovorans TaxID=121608 RepID=UPI000FD713D9|nr:extracellular solute-binding protein [Paenibacillus koleovorans]